MKLVTNKVPFISAKLVNDRRQSQKGYHLCDLLFLGHEEQYSTGGATFLTGHFVGVYLKQCLVQFAEKQKEESGLLFMSHF